MYFILTRERELTVDFVTYIYDFRAGSKLGYLVHLNSIYGMTGHSTRLSTSAQTSLLRSVQTVEWGPLSRY